MSKMSGMVCPKYGVGTVSSLSDRRLSKMSRSIVSIASVASVEDCPECAGAVSRMCGAGVRNVRGRCPECAGAVSRMCGCGVQNVYSIPLFQLFPDHGKNRGEQVSNIIFLKKCFFLEIGLAIFFAI